MTTLEWLLPALDSVIVTCTLASETHGLFNVGHFALVNPTAVFINSSYGAIVEQNVLVSTLL